MLARRASAPTARAGGGGAHGRGGCHSQTRCLLRCPAAKYLWHHLLCMLCCACHAVPAVLCRSKVPAARPAVLCRAAVKCLLCMPCCACCAVPQSSTCGGTPGRGTCPSSCSSGGRGPWATTATSRARSRRRWARFVWGGGGWGGRGCEGAEGGGAGLMHPARATGAHGGCALMSCCRTALLPLA